MTPFSLEEIMRGTRYHQAGHAVAAYHHGYRITGVTVGDEECRTYFGRPIFDGWADKWREACVTMAGPLADQRALWGEMRPEPWTEFLAEAEEELEVVEDGEEWLRGDHSDLLQLLRRMGEDPTMDTGPEESYRIVLEDSRALVNEFWAEIEAVARALEEKDTLGGPEVVRIIEQTRK
jgi:hypothetical protein